MARKAEEKKAIEVMEDKFNTGETKYFDQYGNPIEPPQKKENNENKEVEDATN